MLGSKILLNSENEKLQEMYKDLFANDNLQLVMEKKKNSTSGILVRQVGLTQSGFIQKNKKEIPFNQEVIIEKKVIFFLFQQNIIKKEEFDQYPPIKKLQMPWCKVGGVGRLYFCRKQDKITLSNVLNFDKPTCVYFQDLKQLQEYKNFIILGRIQGKLKYNKILPNNFYHSIVQFSRRSLKIQADIIRDQQKKIKDQRRKELLNHNQIETFDSKIMRQLIQQMIIEAKEKESIEREENEREAKEKVINQIIIKQEFQWDKMMRKQNIVQSEVLTDVKQEIFHEFFKCWQSKANDFFERVQNQLKREDEEIELLLLEQQMEEQRQEQHRLEEMRRQQSEARKLMVDMNQQERMLQLEEEERQLMEDNDRILAEQLQKQEQLSTPHGESIHSELIISDLSLQTDSALEILKPKLTIVLQMIELPQRKRTVIPLQAAQQGHKIDVDKVYFEDSRDLLVDQSVGQYTSDGHYVINGYSMKDQIHFYISGSEVGSFETQEHNILYGVLGFHQIFKSKYEVKRMVIPMQFRSGQQYQNIPILSIQVAYGHHQNYLDSLSQAASNLIGEMANVPEPLYSEVMRYPLNKREYQIMKSQRITKQVRLQDFKVGLHNRQQSQANSIWSRNEMRDILETMKNLYK